MSSAGRIAFICPRFAEGSAGGAETLLRNLAERAQSAGRQVVFLTTCATDHFTWRNERPAGPCRVGALDVHFFPVDEDRDVAEFLRVQEVISRKGHVSPEDELAWIENSVNSRALCGHLRDHAAEYDRIVAGPYLFGITYAVARAHPGKTLLVPCLHDEGFAYVGLFRRMFRDALGVLFNSLPEQELGMRLYELSAAKCSVVGMGLDPFDVDPEAFGRRHSISAPYIIYSGRREQAKGVPLLMDYLALFRERTGRDVELVLTGSGTVDPPAGLAPHIIDVGFVTEQEKHEAMAGAAAFCHPSVNESLSIVVLESWLAGTPVMVHAKCAVTRHHCRESNGGLWFAAYPQFEEGLSLLLDNPGLRRAMGGAGRDYVTKEYSWASVMPRLLTALDGPAPE